MPSIARLFSKILWPSSIARSKGRSGSAKLSRNNLSDRSLRFEPLEDRQLLSVGAGGAVQSLTNATVGNAAAVLQGAAVPAAAVGVSISDVVVTEAKRQDGILDSTDQLIITWAVDNAASVGSKSLTVDGAPVTQIYGPYAAGADRWFLSGTFGPLSGGVHNYTIQSTDGQGNAASSSGSFTVVAVNTTISGVVVGEAHRNDGFLDSSDQLVISWAFNGAADVASKSLTVDGNPVSALYGPYDQGHGTFYMSGLFGPLSAGSHSYTIESADSQGNAATASGTFNVAAAAYAPTISNTVADPMAKTPLITWNVLDSNGIASASLTVDGKAVKTINGPYGTKYNANYSGAIGTLPVGDHTYVIEATDDIGGATTYTGTFTVFGPPTISAVIVLPQAVDPAITWNVADKSGIASSSITVDGKAVTTVYGPYGTNDNANFGGAIGWLPNGNHTYAIKATDTLGFTATSTGTFTVADTPAISAVVVLPQAVDPAITWNVADNNGIASSSITVDGKAVTTVYGPLGTKYNASFGGAIGWLSSGSHSYVITATNNIGTSSQFTGTLVVGPVISGVVVSVGQGVITWNTLDPVALTSSVLAIDGTVVANIYGPYSAPSGANFAGVIGELSAGSHTYTITATDVQGFSATSTDTFRTYSPDA